MRPACNWNLFLQTYRWVEMYVSLYRLTVMPHHGATSPGNLPNHMFYLSRNERYPSRCLVDGSLDKAVL